MPREGFERLNKVSYLAFDVLLIAKLALQLVLGAGFVHFGVVLLRGDQDTPLSFEPMDLTRPAEVMCGIIALAAGVGLFVGLGLPDAGTIGSTLAASVLVLVLVGDAPEYGSSLAKVCATVALLVLVTLVGACHWPHQPPLAWWP